ncbi:SCO family protein [Cytobacillus pseudoceanisediminis]|uniref:SCO family protein n=1 Tax=Cytobacillus pseudoceanisediminis TaxID=3051614 RepID=A0ABZ2ZQC0_9BACI|nr:MULTISPECIES: SCO family protein [Cytobacillus]EFV76005.1 manganese oxidation [Bacillus sp. 2_A_57_CT2]QOK28530.1 SCO family protein [Cytobacillus oceanisediminis]
MKKVYIISAIIVILGIAAGISFFIIRDMTAKIPDHITLLTDDEKLYDFAESDKKLKLVEFIYTHCPDICPTTTQRMNLLKGDLSKEGVFGEKVQFITVTIDPYRDTAEVLRKYRNTFEIENDGDWVFLTAEPDKLKKDQSEIQELANTFQFQYRDPGDGFYVHSTFVYLLDENNKFIKKFPMGEDFDKNDVFNKIMKQI